jgi:hypothetical protein
METIDYQLIVACRDGDKGEVKRLLDAGADVNALNGEALINASIFCRTEIANDLLDAGADVHALDDLALRVASYKKHADVVEILQKAMEKNND